VEPLNLDGILRQMTDGSPVAPVPPAPAPPPSASRLRREKPGPRRGRPLVWLLALAAFVTFAIVFFGRLPERVTYAEAIDIAARIERSKTAADFRPLLDVRLAAVPASGTEAQELDVSDALAEQLSALASRAEIARIEIVIDDRGRRTVLFRYHRRVQLHDFVRLVLERRADGPRVTEYYQLGWGGWLDKCLPAEQTAATLRAAMDTDKTAPALGKWPAESHRSAAFASAQLAWLVDHDPKAFPAALERFRADFPRNTAADFVIATRWLTLGLKPEDAITALDRIQEDHFDPDFLSQLREKVWK
jgi:hypothetical protein